jgi:hypothetical protein
LQVHLREATPGTHTPNCVECSRSIVHAECSVLHLVDDGWRIERGLFRSRGERGERSEVEAQETGRVREQ